MPAVELMMTGEMVLVICFLNPEIAKKAHQHAAQCRRNTCYGDQCILVYPERLRIAGFTKIIYAIVRKVVNPSINSLRKELEGSKIQK